MLYPLHKLSQRTGSLFHLCINLSLTYILISFAYHLILKFYTCGLKSYLINLSFWLIISLVPNASIVSTANVGYVNMNNFVVGSTYYLQVKRMLVFPVHVSIFMWVRCWTHYLDMCPIDCTEDVCKIIFIIEKLRMPFN